MTTDVDWWEWARRWDEQQERYLPHRDERFALMGDLIAARRGESGLRILDLCCGNGSISRRLLDRFPDAQIVAVDLDPVHLEIGRRTLGDRVTWLEADLRGDRWFEELATQGFDAVVTATALHWLEPHDLVRLYARLAGLLREGGLFLDADHHGVDSPVVAATAWELLRRWQDVQLATGEGHGEYHTSAHAEPELAALAEERERRFADRTGTDEGAPSAAFHREALLAAGFREVGEVWRYLSDSLIMAVS
jgi:SAM-dependent methyltransferase